jgi:CheY-like chemotaxis protein
MIPSSAEYHLHELQGKKILVVDDNLTNRAILKSQLEQWKLTTVLASSGQQALDILSVDSAFDLVLTDMQMPFMDGTMLAQKIRDQYPHIPIVLLSSIGDEYNNDQQLFHSVLSKPIRQHVLRKHISSGFQRTDKSIGEEKTTHTKLPFNFSELYPLQIMIAEDNLINQQVILHILQNLGYLPTLVENGQEAVAMARDRHFDMILMDMQMPEMDGLEATRIIRKTLQNQPVVIALTANTMQGDQQDCLNAGMDDYISKPVNLDELVKKLEKWALHKMTG